MPMKTYTIRVDNRPICTADAINARFMQKQIVDEVQWRGAINGNITVTDNETNEVIYSLTITTSDAWKALVK